MLGAAKAMTCAEMKGNGREKQRRAGAERSREMQRLCKDTQRHGPAQTCKGEATRSRGDDLERNVRQGRRREWLWHGSAGQGKGTEEQNDDMLWKSGAEMRHGDALRRTGCTAVAMERDEKRGQ